MEIPKVGSGLLQIDPAHSGIFPRHFFKNSNKKVNKGTLQEREQTKIVDVKKEIQNSLEKMGL